MTGGETAVDQYGDVRLSYNRLAMLKGLLFALFVLTFQPTPAPEFVFDKDKGGGEVTYEVPGDKLFESTLFVASQISNISFSDRSLRTLTAKFHEDPAGSTVRYTATVFEVDNSRARLRLDVHGTRFGVRGRRNDKAVRTFVKTLNERLAAADASAANK